MTHENVKHYAIQNGLELYTMFSYDDKHRFEVYRQVFQPHTVYASTKHKGRRWKYMITKRTFTLNFDDQEYEIREGEALQFLADCDQSYMNNTDEVTEIVGIIYYE